jgi:8-oxo-dGTP pyrophosphatase MutT (NUDIX family)
MAATKTAAKKPAVPKKNDKPSASDLKASENNHLAKALTAADRERKWAYIRPKNAATLILLDHSGPTPKVLMGKRHEGHKFMPGKFVFPGGRIEANDRKMAAVAPLDPEVSAKLDKRRVRPSPTLARALALAAIRETFEETGLLLGRKTQVDTAKTPAGPWADFVAHGVAPDLSQVRFIARAITPPRRPKRFDTTFLCMDADAIAHRIEGVVGPDTELVELVWVPLQEAQQLDLPPITRVVLEELEKRLEAGMAHALPCPFYYEVSRKWRREEL